MNTQETHQRRLTATLDRMKTAAHLPQDLVALLGKTAALQLSTQDPVCLDLSGPNRSDALPVDMAHARRLAARIIDMVLDPLSEPAVPLAMAEAARLLKQGLDTFSLDFDGAAAEIMAGQGPICQAWAEKTPEAPGALRFLVLAALTPSLAAAAPAVADLRGIKADEIRNTGGCPVCGHPPYILELRGKEGFRFAVCSLCRFEYRIRRLACPACNTSDPDHIKYFTVDPEPGFRVETCDSCHTYIKTIDFRQMDRKAFAPLNDLESLALDFLAEKQGYTRSAPSVWGI